MQHRGGEFPLLFQQAATLTYNKFAIEGQFVPQIYCVGILWLGIAKTKGKASRTHQHQNNNNKFIKSNKQHHSDRPQIQSLSPFQAC